MRKIICSIVIFVLVLAVNSPAEKGRGGATGAYLQLNLSARAMGMGGAFSGVADDASAMFYNPAGIAQVRVSAVNASYRKMDFDRRLGFISVSLPTREESALSVGWIFAGSGEIEGRDNEAVLTGEKLSYSENTICLAFARKFGDLFSLGATGKYFITKLANLNTTAVGFDLGAMLILNRENLLRNSKLIDLVRFGIVVENMGGSRRWSTGAYWGQFGEIGVSIDEKMPIGIESGISALMLDTSLLVSLDLEKYADQNLRFFAGGEYVLKHILALRAGYADKRLTFGGGVCKRFEYYAIKIDYAYASSLHGEAADHLFTLGFEFK